MSKVNFYLLKQHSPQSRIALVCRLCEQLQKQGRAVHILAEDEDAARELDTLLWQYTPESFLPHALASESNSSGLTLCWPAMEPAEGTLLNLTDSIPAHHASLQSIAEFVINDDAAKALGREKWNTYKQSGHELQHHQL